MQQNQPRERVVAVDRALTLLTLLGSQDSLTVTDAARALQVAPSTAHRLLSTLLHRGFAIQHRRRGYAAGPALLTLSQSRGTESVVGRVRPYLEQLFDATQETCHVLVREGALVRFVDGVEGAQGLRVGLRTGIHMAALRTSGGKAMLAELSQAELDVLLHPRVSRLVDQEAGIAGELARVRGQRLGLNRDESEPGVTALGASIGVVDGQHVALTVAMPTARVTATRTRELSHLLLTVCEQARADLGQA